MTAAQARPRRRGPEYRLVLDPIRCDGRGLCAELLPEGIRLDDWGYPILDGRPIPPALLEMARRAVKACPTLALKIERAPPA
ncbi:MAG: ferredoxin [Acidimicrobiales bacterium]